MSSKATILLMLVGISGLGTWLLAWNEDLLEAVIYHHQIQLGMRMCSKQRSTIIR